MEREQARALMKEYRALGETLNRITLLIDQITDETQGKKFRRAVGSIMQIVDLELMLPIERTYPDLDG